MLEKIQEIYNISTGRDDLILTPKSKFKDVLEGYSFGLVYMICAVEEEFGLSIPNDKLKKMKTVKDLIDYIETNTQ